MALVAPASKAQNYSLNIVGYAAVTVAPGYSLLANPLNAGVTNGANEVMSILDGEQILTWTGSRFDQVGYDSGFGGWVGADGQTPVKPPSLPPGKGFFFLNPAPTATNLTFVGEVGLAPGSPNCLYLPPGYSLIGSPLPATVNQITNPPVSMPVIDGMSILEWSGTHYLQTGFDSGFGGWVLGDGVTPSVAPPYSIGQGFFFLNPSASPYSWCQRLPSSAKAASPALSVSRVPPTSVQISWPSNFTAGWALMYTTNLASADWQPVSQTAVSSGDALVVLFPFTNSSGFFRLQNAQNYSLNIVGYATVTVAPGYNLLANPLNAGVTNGANEIMSILDGEQILTWTGRGYVQVGYDSGFGGWVGSDGLTPVEPPSLPPGEGFFFLNPAPTATNLTFVGEVNLTNCLSLSPGYSMIGSPLPATVNQITNPPVSVPVIDGMQLLEWSGTHYLTTGFDSGFGGWVGADGQTPSVAPPYSIGQGFFLNNPSASPYSWCPHLPFSTGPALPALSVSRIPPTSVQISWPSNFTAGWTLMCTTNLASANWQPVAQAPVLSGNLLVVSLPMTNLSEFFLLQQNSGGGGGCVFQAAPPTITAGGSSTLSWCPQPGTTYSVSPGPGIVTGGSLVVSPTVTTVYSLTTSNASGLETNNAAVIVNPCGWLQVNKWNVSMNFSYSLAPSASGYTFDVSQSAYVTFNLTRQSGTATDAYYFGFATGVGATINDKEVDATGPRTFTTTEVSSGGTGSPVLNLSTLFLHLTCNSYDFSYNVLVNTTETSDFGVFPGSDGVGSGAITSRPLPGGTNEIFESEHVLAQYPPANAQYFAPSSDLGKAMFSTGTATTSNAGNAFLAWIFTPAP
jgi:hypothetical protein